MTPDELRTAQDAVTKPVTLATLAVLRRLPMTPLSPRQWAQLTALLFPSVVAGRSKSVLLARRFYTSQNPAGTSPNVPVREYTPQMLAKTLTRYAAGRIEHSETHETAARDTAAAVGRHVEQAGREWVGVAAGKDGVKYARVDPRGETCSFCQLLISRGAVYLSDATGAFQSHPGCTCVAVPVFDETDWPGMDQAEAADALYRQSTAGLSGKDAIRAFRRAVEGTG